MKDFDIYLAERLKEYDLLIGERRNEYIIFLKERLMECDIIVESLLYRDYLEAEDRLILESCIEQYRLLKLISVSVGAELDARIDKMVVRCHEKISANIAPHHGILGTTIRNYTSAESAAITQAEVPAFTTMLMSADESGVSLCASLLDIDANTKFDGIEMAISPSAECTGGARKFLRIEDALQIGAVTQNTVHKFASSENNDIAICCGVLGTQLVKLRYVNELDDMAVSELDGSTLSELDYTTIES